MSVAPISVNSASSGPSAASSALGPMAFTTVPAEIPNEQRELMQAVRSVDPTELFGDNTELTFVFDRETRRIVVRVVDAKSREVRLQIPPEYLLEMAKNRTAE